MATTELVRGPVSRSTDAGPGHIAASCCPPYEQTLCGRPIAPEDAMDDEAECVVCLSMEANCPPCTNCGDR